MEYSAFLNEYLTIEYSPNHQAIYCLIDKVYNNQLFLVVSQDFEKAGLLENDIVKCKIDREQDEFSFNARIITLAKGIVGLNLIIEPISEIEEFYNLRSEKRINYKFIAFTENDILTSVKNISKSGILITTTANYSKGSRIKLKLIFDYPRVECVLTGIVIRINECFNNKKEYGIKILNFENETEATRYLEFVNTVTERLLP